MALTIKETELVYLGASIAASIALNSTSTLNNYLALGKSRGLTDVELNNIYAIAKFIKRKAASHVDKISLRIEKTKTIENDKEQSDNCGCSGSTISYDQKKSSDLDANNGNKCC